MVSRYVHHTCPTPEVHAALGQPVRQASALVREGGTCHFVKKERNTSVATYCRWGGNPRIVYIQNFPIRINWWKNFENRSTFAKVIWTSRASILFEPMQCISFSSFFPVCRLIINFFCYGRFQVQVQVIIHVPPVSAPDCVVLIHALRAKLKHCWFTHTVGRLTRRRMLLTRPSEILHHSSRGLEASAWPEHVVV